MACGHGAVRRLETVGALVVTAKSSLVWSDDGTLVTKTLLASEATAPRSPVLGTAKRAALNELRVNRLFASWRPPMRVPAMVGTSRRGPTMTFQGIDGGPLATKYPTSLSGTDIAQLLGLSLSLEHFQPKRRWLRRPRVHHRLMLHRRSGLITNRDAVAITALADRCSSGWQFAHGDLTARNVLRDSAGALWLIDWEWAGLYPAGYDLAFLWFSLIDLPGGRAQVQAAIPAGREASFLLSAIIIQLLHQQMWLGRPTPFLANHRRTLEALLAAVRVADQPGASVTDLLST
jgi:hypothetical protein